MTLASWLLVGSLTILIVALVAVLYAIARSAHR